MRGAEGITTVRLGRSSNDTCSERSNNYIRTVEPNEQSWMVRTEAPSCRVSASVVYFGNVLGEMRRGAMASKST